MALAKQVEPKARWLPASFRIGSYMYIWAGRRCQTDVVERLNLSTFTYEQSHLTNSSAPDGLDSMAVTWDKSHGYTFGGRDGNRKELNSIYCLDFSTLKCIEIVPATGSDTPTPRVYCGMVHFNRKLVVYGGGTDDGNISSDLLLFDLDNKTWSVQDTTGEKPPGLYCHTFNMIDSHRASLFGGDDGDSLHNDTYLLDMRTWCWTKVQIKGNKPAPRRYHSTLCIEDPHTGDHPLLMVVGGLGVGYSVLSDVWLLDVINGVWAELSLPTDITERYRHTAVLFGTGVDFRVAVLFGGCNNSHDDISETTLLLLSRKGRSWVVDRVVGPADWMTPDDTLREQMKRLQIYAPSYTHHVLDDRFPGICFLGEPHEVTVQSEAVTISPPGHGISLKIPPNAIQSSDKPVNVSLQTCLSSSVFQYPEGCTPLSAVYHISSDMAFDKDVELTFEHFAELETDKQANEMTFLRAEAQGEGKYIFVPMEGGEFKVGGHRCTISTQQMKFFSAGSISSSEIRKRYTVLFSYSNEIEAIRHAAVAISLDDAVYLTNFRKALEEEWKVPLSHRCKLNVSFIEGSACVEYDPTNLKGWSVISNALPCTLSQEDVDYFNATTLTQYDYPPRVIFEISPSDNAEPSTLQFNVTGITKPIDFQVPLRKISQVSEGKTENFQSSTGTAYYTTDPHSSTGTTYTTDPQSSTGTAYYTTDPQSSMSTTDPHSSTGTTYTTDPQSSMSTTDLQSSTVTTYTTDSEKPNLRTLMNLSTSEGEIKIIQKSAKYYRGVGTILLNDRHGERVDVFEQDTRWKSEAMVLQIYKEWLGEDPSCSWMTLTDCFRECGADRLAYSIEQHFGLPSPPQNPEDSSSLDSDPVSHDQMSSPSEQAVKDEGTNQHEVTSDSDTETEEEISVNTMDDGSLADLESISEVVLATPNEGMMGMLWSRKELVATVAIPITAIILFFLYKYLK